MNNSLARIARTGVSASLIALALAGCRREDVRVFDEPMGAGVSESQARKELSHFAGVKMDTMKFEGGKLHVEYDSMQLAKENIRRVIGR